MERTIMYIRGTDTVLAAVIPDDEIWVAVQHPFGARFHFLLRDDGIICPDGCECPISARPTTK